MSSVSVGSPKRWTASEVVLVACFKQVVTLEANCWERIPKFGNQTPDYTFGDLPSVTPEQALPEEICRAGLFCRLLSLTQGRPSVRPAVLQTITALLNANILPCFTSNLCAGEELVAVLEGRGFCRTPDGRVQPTGELLSPAGIDAVSLKTTEANAFIGHPFVSIGAACLLSAGSVNLMKMMDAIVALGCEVTCVKTEVFDSASFETNRAHRGQMLSASNIRILLEGSKRVNTTPAVGSAIGSSAEFHNAPQVHGPCQETISAAAKAIEIELNSFESAPLDSGAGVSFSPCQSVLNICNISTAVDMLIKTSNMRRSALMRSNEPMMDSAGAGGSVNSGESVNDWSAVGFVKLLSLSQSLCKELQAAVNALASLEPAEEESAAAAGPAKEVPTAAMANLKVSQDDSKLTPEQLAKVEAKRKAKAEKDAAKAAAKAAKKSGKNRLVLGAGCTLVRQFVVDKSAGASAGATGVSEATSRALVNPFDFSESGFAAFCVGVLEQLNAGGKRRPKIAKGTRDYGPEQMRIREQAFSAIRRVFKRHGAVEIDTPVFELKEVLTGKYGEDSKLIYDLADQGGELLSLRYDLTVPFARFLAMNSVGNIKRFHIARVYRRDQPQLNRGRYREFYQCDFDIAGSYSPMVPDAEVLSCVVEILRELPVGDFMVKLNHRKLLDAVFDICGVPMTKFRPICSAVDKLDKNTWEEVKAEMVEEKGLDPAVADRIGTFVCHSGEPKAMWQKLVDMGLFGTHQGASDAMKDLQILFDFLEAMGTLNNVSFDLSLARGLDYYTGVIYEAVLVDGAAAVGSIAAGGRYDNLVGMFSPSGTQTPCVGVSVGIERVFTIMERKAEERKMMHAATVQVYVASIGGDLLMERMKVARLLWNANISAEYSHAENPKLKRQMDDSLEKGIPFMVVFGKEELADGKLKIKNMAAHTEVEVEYQNVVECLLLQGCLQVGGDADNSFLKALKEAVPPSSTA